MSFIHDLLNSLKHGPSKIRSHRTLETKTISIPHCSFPCQVKTKQSLHSRYVQPQMWTFQLLTGPQSTFHHCVHVSRKVAVWMAQPTLTAMLTRRNFGEMNSRDPRRRRQSFGPGFLNLRKCWTRESSRELQRPLEIRRRRSEDEVPMRWEGLLILLLGKAWTNQGYKIMVDPLKRLSMT